MQPTFLFAGFVLWVLTNLFAGALSPPALFLLSYNALLRNWFIYEQPPAMSRSPKSECHDSQRRINEAGKFSLMNEITKWRPCSGVSRGYVNRIHLWPLRRDDHSGVLIGTGGTGRSNWPARVLANDVSVKIDR